MAASPSDAAGIAIAVAAADLEGCANPYCTETAKPKLNPFCSIGCGQFYWYNQSLLLRAQEDGQLDQSGGAFVRQGGSGGSGNSHDHSCDRACGRSRSRSHDADMTSMPDMTMAFQTKDPWRPMAVPDCPLIPLDKVQEEEEDQEEEDQEEEEKMYESPWSDDGVPHYSTATMDLTMAAVQKNLDESPPDSNFHKLIKRRPASSMAPPSTKKARSNSDEDEVQIDEGAVHDELGEDPEEAPKHRVTSSSIPSSWATSTSDFRIIHLMLAIWGMNGARGNTWNGTLSTCMSDFRVNQPASQPVNQPTNQPTNHCTTNHNPSNQANTQPSNQAANQPSNQHTYIHTYTQ